VYVNPEADMAYYRKVAVLPFTSLSPDLYAGARVTRGFITELILTNRYEIVQPDEFRIVLDRIGGLSAREGAYDPAKLEQAAKDLEVTGVIRGAVTEYQMQRSGGGEIPVISFDAELIDVATTKVVWRASITKRGKGRVPVLGGGGARSLGRLTQMACEELVGRLRKEAL
jgi:hypothetical protein